MPYVNIELSDLDSEEMIEELESRGFNISPNSSDAIYNLYRDYIDGKDFDQKLKKFFEGQLGLIVH